MIGLSLLLWFSFIGQLPADISSTVPPGNRPLEKSAWFAFVDRDYIFTVEIVKPGVPLLNFVSMTDEDAKLQAKNVRFTLENRKAAAKAFCHRNRRLIAGDNHGCFDHTSKILFRSPGERGF